MNLLRKLCGPSKQFKVQVFADISGAWRHRIVHTNGNIIATSEAYSSQSAAMDTATHLASEANFKLEASLT